jgi:hypothetical protein
MTQRPEDPMPQAAIDELKAMYRETAGEQPSAGHDAAVLAAMHAELAAARRAKARPLRKWQLPMALAATVVLTVALTLTVEREQPSENFAPMLRAPLEVAPVSAPPAGNAPRTPQPGAKLLPGKNAQGLVQPGFGAGKPAAPTAPEPQVQERAFAPPVVLPDVLAEPPAITPAPAAPQAPGVNDARARSRLLESGVRGESVDKAQSNSGADAAAAQSMRIQAAPPAAPRESLDAAKSRTPTPPDEYLSKPATPAQEASPPPPRARTPEPTPRAFAPEPPAPAKPEAAPPPLPAPAPPPPAPKPAPATTGIISPATPVPKPEPPAEVQLKKRADAATQVRPPHEWLDVIRGLRRAGRDAEAVTELKKFREAYPDYPVPAELTKPVTH